MKKSINTTIPAPQGNMYAINLSIEEIPRGASAPIINFVQSDGGAEASTAEAEAPVAKPCIVGGRSKAQARLEALAKAGVDTKSYFTLDSGQIIRSGGEGFSVVPDDDPIFAMIREEGTVPERRLFRRWVMSQMFHALRYPGGFNSWLRAHRYKYMWNMTLTELAVQAKLEERDKECFEERNMFFNKAMVLEMCLDYTRRFHEYVDKQFKTNAHRNTKCGCYICMVGAKWTLDRITDELYSPMTKALGYIERSENARELLMSFRTFYNLVFFHLVLSMAPSFVDAYKGAGAYFTMKNLILFHGARILYTDSNRNRISLDKDTSLVCMQKAARRHAADGEGYKLFAMMKDMMEYNGIDIEAKFAEWAEAKAKKLNK